MRKRFHLDKWYHWIYFFTLVIVSWYKASYLSLINWTYYCLLIYNMGFKFLEEQRLSTFKTIIKSHLIFSCFILISLTFSLIGSLINDQFMLYLLSKLNYDVTSSVFGYTSAFALIISQTILYLILVLSLVLIYIEAIPPDNQENEDFTFQQRKKSYLRSQSIMDKIMMLIVAQLCLNDGMITLFLVLCMFIWLALHFHLIRKTKRFIYCKYVTQMVAVGAFLSLVLLILSGSQFSALNGSLAVYKIFKAVGVIMMSALLMCSIRATHYQSIIGEEHVEELERDIQKDLRLKITSLEILLGENYFGVIMVLSVFWISKQFSVLRGIVYLILLVGQLKRKRYKATRRWQCAISILYVAFVQFFLLELFNIPYLKVSVYFQYLGVYEQPEFNPQEMFALWHFFYDRFHVIMIDLFYILIVSWLVYSQQTIDDRRHQKIINDLDQKGRPNRDERPGCWERFKQGAESFASQVQQSFLIHFDEVVVIYCLITALSHADICRGVFLVFFILYAFAPLWKRRKYMRTHLSIGYVILFLLYSMQLMFLRSLSTLNFIFKFGGLDEVTQQFKFPFYFIYKYYDIITGCILLTFQIQIIQKSSAYQEYKRNNENYNLDFLRRLLQHNGLIYCQITALIVAFIPPANLLSLIFIFFFQLFLYLYYLYRKLDTIMDRMYQYWPLMITLTLIILIVRYSYTIKFVYYFVELYFQQPTLLSDFGLDPGFNTLKLAGTGIALLLLCAYERAYLAPKIIDQQEKIIYKDGTFSYYIYGILMRLSVYGVYHIQKITFMFAFFIAVYQLSYIGFLFAIMIFVIMLKEMHNNWHEISIPILVIIFLQILIQYVFQAELLRTAQGQETISWIGIENQYQNKYWHLLVMFHLCEMLQVLNTLVRSKTEDYFHLFLLDYDREIKNLEHLKTLLQHFKQQKISELNSLESENSQQPIILEQSESFEMNDLDLTEERYEKLLQFYSAKSIKQQGQFYLQVYPFYRALKFHQYIDGLFTQIGLEICLFFIVITAYYQRNFFSVFYIIVASAFANRSFMLDRLSQLGRFGQSWGALCILQMIEVIRKYGTLQWTPPSWDVRKPWWYFSYGCDPRGKEAFNQDDPDDSTSDFMKCQTDWSYWLSLQGYSNWDLWINFIALLISVCYYRHFKTIRNRQQEAEVAHSISSQLYPDKNDFTFAENRTKIMDFIKFFVFCYFYKFALIVFLMIGMSSDIQSYTEVISCVYFFLAVNLLYMSEKLEKERNSIWSKLILFNTIVMIAMSLYQAPFIKCPIIYENNRYYYDNVECVQIQLNNHYYNSDFFIFLQDEFQLLARQSSEVLKKYEGVSTLDVIYMFLSHLLGLNKTLDFRFGFSKETLMAFFFLLGLLQRNIWAHPYMKLYVDPYLQRQQQKQQVAAIQLIEGIHLKRIWDFKYVQAQKQVHESLQQRVSSRVKKWDEWFQFDPDQAQKDFFYMIPKRQEFTLLEFYEEQSDDNVKHTSFDSEKYKVFSGDPKQVIRAEKITQQNVAPIIHLYDACSIVNNAKNETDLQLRLKKLMLLEEKRQLEKVYLNDRIGLTNYYTNMIQEINKNVHQVDNELAQLFHVVQQNRSSLQRSTSMQQLQIIPFEEFDEERKSFQMFSDREEEQQNIPNNSSEEHQQPEIRLTSTDTKKTQKKTFNEKLKEVIIYILTHDTYIREQQYQQSEIDKKKLSVLIFVFVAHYFQSVCVLLMVVNACFNANILALFYPFSAFLYGLLENPVPSKRYWNFLLIYTIIVISLKFIYQMPVFCDSPPYRFIGFSQEEACEPRVTTQLEKITRIDYVIGVRKYQGVETFMSSIWIELMLFIALLIQRYLLQSQGIWDYMKLSLDQYFVPQFQQPHEIIKSEHSTDRDSKAKESNSDDFSENHEPEEKIAQQSLMTTIQDSFSSTFKQLNNYFYRLFPHALPTVYTQRKLDPEKGEIINKNGVMLPEQIKVGRDFYAPGFVICLIILVYFLLFYPNIIAKRSYAHITQGQSQRFSSEVIFVLLVVITIIVLDRALFIIRKVTKDPRSEARPNQSGSDFQKYTLVIKTCIHCTLIIVVHYYFFFVIPQKTNKRFQESYYLIFAYVLVCMYFMVSSVQIRYGYPIQKYTHIFTNSHKPANSIAFKIYRMIPFLYELRVIIDWTFTTTALDLIQWFRLEDIFANLYICQAYQHSRLENHKLGDPRRASDKCLNGCLYAVFIIFIIILPILIFSTLNPAVEINNITNGRFSIKAAFFGQDDKLFFTLFQVNDIELLDIPNDQFKKIQKIYGEIETSWQERMQKIRIKRFSDLEWNLPENYRDQIRNMIKSQEYRVEIQCEWVFQKSDSQGGAKSFTGSSIVAAPDTFVNNFGKILAPRAPDAVFDIKALVPKFLYVGESAETQALRLEPVNIREEISYFQDIRLIHKKTSDFVFFELVPNDDSTDLKQIGASSQNRIEFFVLNELAFGSLLGALSNNMSIIGIYATFVLTIGRFLRFTYDKISTRVMFEEMPETYELFDLCQSIYIARVDGDFFKEEIFYELLIRIYRSPEILFKMTGASIYDNKKNNESIDQVHQHHLMAPLKPFYPNQNLEDKRIKTAAKEFHDFLKEAIDEDHQHLLNADQSIIKEEITKIPLPATAAEIKELVFELKRIQGEEEQLLVHFLGQAKALDNNDKTSLKRMKDFFEGFYYEVVIRSNDKKKLYEKILLREEQLQKHLAQLDTNMVKMERNYEAMKKWHEVRSLRQTGQIVQQISRYKNSVTKMQTILVPKNISVQALSQDFLTKNVNIKNQQNSGIHEDVMSKPNAITSAPNLEYKPIQFIELEQNAKEIEIDETSVYDWIVDIDLITTIAKNGWKVYLSKKYADSQVKQEADLPNYGFTKHSPKQWEGAAVAVVGLYDKGKTFVLNNLTSSNLPSGKKVTTKGVSFKHVNVDSGTQLILVDTAGSYSPVRIINELSIVEKEATEMFITDLVFEISDYFICVVNDFTSLDQRYLDRLSRNLQNSPNKTFREIIVIHNLKEVESAEILEHVWSTQVTQIYSNGSIQRTKVASINPINNLLQEKHVLWFKTEFTRHVCLVNDDSYLGMSINPWVFSLLRYWLKSVFVPVNRQFSVVDSIIQFSKTKLSSYFRTLLTLQIQDTEDFLIKTIVTQQEVQDSNVRIPQVSIDSSGLIMTRPDSFLPNTDIIATDQYIIYMDVPGLTKNEILVYRQNVVTIIKGIRKRPYDEKLERSERKYGEFALSFKIPEIYERKWSTFTVENGVLTIVYEKDKDDQIVRKKPE